MQNGQNKIYQQVGGTCVAYAIANILEIKHGIRVSDRDIERIYEEYDTDGREGMRATEILEALKEMPLRGYLVEDYERIFFAYGRQRHSYTRRFHLALRAGEPILLGLKFRGQKGLKLDDDYFMKINKGERFGGFHAVTVVSHEGNDVLKCENTWGDKWGHNGYFYINLLDVLTEGTEAYLINFKKYVI